MSYTAAPVKQNKMLLERTTLNSNFNLSMNFIYNKSDVHTINTCKNGYFVMHDFNNLLIKFTGREPGQETQFWSIMGRIGQRKNG